MESKSDLDVKDGRDGSDKDIPPADDENEQEPNLEDDEPPRKMKREVSPSHDEAAESGNQVHRPGFDSLPRELQIEVFSHMTHSELSHSVAPVCRRWENLSKDPDLWTSVTIDPRKSVTSNKLADIFQQRARLIKRLDISGRQLSLNDVETWAAHCGTLRDLNMGHCTFAPGEMLSIFETLVTNCPLIEKLDVYDTRIDHECVMALTGFSHLKEIDFRGCDGVQNESVKGINDQFTGLTKFKYCPKSSESDVTEDTAINLIKKQNNSLTELLLAGGPWTDETATALATCQHLNILRLCNCDQMTDESLSVMKLMASRLKELTLWHAHNFSSAALSGFFKDNQMKNLVELCLFKFTNLGDEMVTDIVAYCGRNLKWLNLGGPNLLTDIAIQKIVSNCSQMEFLYLECIAGITGHPLSRIPECMTRLKHLVVSHCSNINHRVVQALEKIEHLTVVRAGIHYEDVHDNDHTDEENDIGGDDV